MCIVVAACCRCCWLCLDLPALSDWLHGGWDVLLVTMSSAWLISWCDFTALYLCLAYKYLCPLYTSVLLIFRSCLYVVLFILCSVPVALSCSHFVLFHLLCPVHTLFCSTCSVLFTLCSVPLALSCSHFDLFHLLCPVHTLFCSTCSVLFTLWSVPLALSCSYFVLFQLLFCLYFVLFHLLRIVVCSTSVLSVCLPCLDFVQNCCMQHECLKCLSALFRLCSELLYAAWVFNCLIALFILCSVPIALSLFALCSVPAAENCCMQHDCFNSLVARHTQSMWCWSAASISRVCASLQQTT